MITNFSSKDEVLEFLKKQNVGNYKKMNQEIRKLLIEYFKSHNQKLYKFLGRDLSWDK